VHLDYKKGPRAANVTIESEKLRDAEFMVNAMAYSRNSSCQECACDTDHNKTADILSDSIIQLELY